MLMKRKEKREKEADATEETLACSSCDDYPDTEFYPSPRASPKPDDDDDDDPETYSSFLSMSEPIHTPARYGGSPDDVKPLVELVSRDFAAAWRQQQASKVQSAERQQKQQATDSYLEQLANTMRTAAARCRQPLASQHYLCSNGDRVQREQELAAANACIAAESHHDSAAAINATEPAARPGKRSYLEDALAIVSAGERSYHTAAESFQPCRFFWQASCRGCMAAASEEQMELRKDRCTH